MWFHLFSTIWIANVKNQWLPIEYFSNFFYWINIIFDLGSPKIIELLIQNGFKPVNVYETLESGIIQTLKTILANWFWLQVSILWTALNFNQQERRKSKIHIYSENELTSTHKIAWEILRSTLQFFTVWFFQFIE